MAFQSNVSNMTQIKEPIYTLTGNTWSLDGGTTRLELGFSAGAHSSDGIDTRNRVVASPTGALLYASLDSTGEFTTVNAGNAGLQMQYNNGLGSLTSILDMTGAGLDYNLLNQFGTGTRSIRFAMSDQINLIYTELSMNETITTLSRDHSGVITSITLTNGTMTLTAPTSLVLGSTKINASALPVGRAAVAVGELFVDTEANITAASDLFVARKV